MKESFDEQSLKGRFLKAEAYLMDALSIVFMTPFLFIEYNTILSYGIRWFQTWNLIDSIAYILQVLSFASESTLMISCSQFAISFYHLIADEHMENKHYDTLLAVQCVLLFIKVQYFGRYSSQKQHFGESVHNRVFGARTSFMEVLARVIDRARWFFVFIILTMVSVSLSFAVLYKDDAVDLFSLFFMRLDEQI